MSSLTLLPLEGLSFSTRSQGQEILCFQGFPFLSSGALQESFIIIPPRRF